MTKIITIFGATGNQGGSVVRAILADPVLSKQYKIRGVTRDSTKPAAKALADKGVEVVNADLSSVQSIAPVVKGADTVFLITNYWESKSRDIEYAQGKNVTDASKAAFVTHLIFSSLINVTKETGGSLPNVPHFDAKADIETYIRASGVPATFVMPGYYMSNLILGLKLQQDGSYLWSLPVSDNARFPLFDVEEDNGKFVVAVIKNRTSVLDKNIFEASEYYTPSRIVTEFTEVTGKKASWVQVSAEQYKSTLPPAFAQEFLENHLLLEGPGYYGARFRTGSGLSDSLSILEQRPTTWKEFVVKNESRFAS
ncbi:hypothetical protein V1514DRAFT_283464 [Lipomyces japonicus]|uniref:uncharacterized protein n=1 Tax=Lipomyces japonicus TaxID=56871 RepID=UPI0034CD04EC